MSGGGGEARGLLSHNNLGDPVDLLVLHEQPGLLKRCMMRVVGEFDGSQAHRDEFARSLLKKNSVSVSVSVSL